MTNCPACNSKVDEKAKFCPECGVQLTNAPSERVWIVAMQEKIRTARHNDAIFNVIAVVGIIIAVAIPFIMRFVVHNNMDIVELGAYNCRYRTFYRQRYRYMVRQQ